MHRPCYAASSIVPTGSRKESGDESLVPSEVSGAIQRSGAVGRPSAVGAGFDLGHCVDMTSAAEAGVTQIARRVTHDTSLEG